MPDTCELEDFLPEMIVSRKQRIYNKKSKHDKDRKHVATKKTKRCHRYDSEQLVKYSDEHRTPVVLSEEVLE